MVFVFKAPTDHKSILAQIIAWNQTGNKPLPELILTKFNDVTMSQSYQVTAKKIQ